MKKLLLLVLSVIMILGMCIPAFAEDQLDLPAYENYYAGTTIEFEVKNPGKVDVSTTAYGVDLDGNKDELDVEYKNVITEVKDLNNKNYVQLGFGEMLFDANKDTHDSENVASFRIEICGKYEEVDKFVVHFTADKNILSPNESFYVGDVTLDYQISWIETDVGYDYVVSSWGTENFEHILHYSAFNTEQSGKHNLSAAAEVVYKNGETENLEVIIDSLSEEVVDINSIMMGDVNLNGEITAADARLALRISAGLESADRIVRAAADMNGDGSVSAADARLILRKSARL